MKDVSRARRPADRALLEVLVERGDSLDQERHTIVFFLRVQADERDGESLFNPLALRLQQLGWAISGMNTGGVTAEAHRMVDPDSVNGMSDEMEGLADEFGVRFDGWECRLLAENSDER